VTFEAGAKHCHATFLTAQTLQAGKHFRKLAQWVQLVAKMKNKCSISQTVCTAGDQEVDSPARTLQHPK